MIINNDEDLSTIESITIEKDSSEEASRVH